MAVSARQKKRQPPFNPEPNLSSGHKETGVGFAAVDLLALES